MLLQSLIGALLGELRWEGGKDSQPPLLNGRVVAYAPQEPFIFDGSVRENIVHLAKTVDESRYRRVVRACALDQDLEEMQDGDGTMLGSRGFQLSGGQRARVALARCCFLEADVYIWDMTLSALDADSARHVFDAVMGPDGMLSASTRILVSHAAHLCDRADNWIRLSATGRLLSSTSSAALASLVQSEPVADRLPKPIVPAVERAVARTATSLVRDEMDKTLSATRSVSWYICFSGVRIPIVVCCLIVMSQIAVLSLGASTERPGSPYSHSVVVAAALTGMFPMLQDLFLAHWASRADAQPGRYLLLLLCISAATTVLQMGKQLLGSLQSVRIATDMHKEMLASLFAARTSFYDNAPVGQLLKYGGRAFALRRRSAGLHCSAH